MNKITVRWQEDRVGFGDRDIEPACRGAVHLFRETNDNVSMKTNQELVLTCFRMLIKKGLLKPEEFVFIMGGVEYTVHQSGKWMNTYPPIPDVAGNFFSEVLAP